MEAITKPLHDGTQMVVRFDNGFGASVVNHSFAYGGCELAVVKFHGPEMGDYSLCYDTPVTDDVLGWMNEITVKAALDEIQALPVAELGA